MVHIGLLFFGIAALLSGDLADDYKKMEHLGFTLHTWVGMGGAFFVLLRFALGIAGPYDLRFTQWVPYTRERLILVKEDIAGLFRLRLPERPTHRGLAGLVQTFGLLSFLLMALTGIFLYYSLEPGQKARGLVHDVKELHEAGQVFLLLFLSLHVGATIAHALAGRHLWRKIFFLKETTDIRRPDTISVSDRGARDMEA
jgi:cytochrome b